MTTPPSPPSGPAPDPAGCPRCQRPIPPGAAHGLCPACLLGAGLFTQPAADAAVSDTPPPQPEDLAPEFPQLEILELLGRGGMGAVYKARQRHLDRLVALKLLRPGLDADPSFAERFTREARALAQLNHPGIVTLHEFGRSPGGLFFIVMEFVDGVTLRQLLQGGRLAPREALAIVPPLCDALQYAHDRGIVHRDIKPENILMDRLGRVKIADFGLAKLAAPGTAADETSGPSSAAAPVAVDLTEAGKVMGTPRYMAPEQREHPAAVDHRADIYALGVVLYQMLTGELPDEKQLQPPSRRVLLDVRLDEIVLRALEQDPALRYAAASELKTRIETLGPPPPTVPPEPPAPPPDAAPGTSKRATPGRSLIAFLWQLVPLTAVWLAFFNRWGVRGWYYFAFGCVLLTLLPGPGLDAFFHVILAPRWKKRLRLLAFAILAGAALYLVRLFSNPGPPAALRSSAQGPDTPVRSGGTREIPVRVGPVHFGETREVLLARRGRPGGYNFETHAFVDYTPTPDSPHGVARSRRWRRVHGVDAFADQEASLPSVALDGVRSRSADARLWDSPAQDTVKHLLEWKRNLADEGDYTSIAAPVRNAAPKTQVYRTASGRFVLLQVSEPDDVGDVRIRYKLVLTTPESSPELRALDWLDHVEGCVGHAWLPDGKDAPEAEWRPPTSRVSNALPGFDAGTPRYLCLWFSHPSFDRLSVSELRLVDPSTGKIAGDPRQETAVSFSESSADHAPDRWLAVTLSPGPYGRLPARVEVRLRFSAGDWSFVNELPLPYRDRRSLADGVSLGVPGQDADGQAVVELTRDPALDTDRDQFDVIAITRDGSRLEHSGHSISTGSTVLERFGFETSLANLRSLEVRKRPVQTQAWTVPLHRERIPSDERSLRLDRAGGTLQDIVQRLRRDCGLRLAFENLDFTPADATTAAQIIAEAERHPPRDEAGQRLLQIARECPDPGTLLDVGARYTGVVEGNTVAEFLDRLTAGTPYAARKLDATWLIQPRAASVLNFPVTLKTAGLSLNEAVSALLAQAPGSHPIGTGMIVAMPVARGIDPCPWLSVQAPKLDFDRIPAAEALCRLTAAASPASVWNLAGYRDSRMLSLSPAPADEVLPVVNQAQTWLRRVDGGDYAQARREGSEALQAASAEADWIAALNRTRAPLGDIATRRLRSASPVRSASEDSGNPRVVLEFSTTFTPGRNAIEALIMEQAPDGGWCASAYAIQPPAPEDTLPEATSPAMAPPQPANTQASLPGRISLPAPPITINVLGKVAHPGAYSIRSDATLLDALAAAGGWTAHASLDKVSVLPLPAAAIQARPAIHSVSAILRGHAINPSIPDRATISVPESIY